MKAMLEFIDQHHTKVWKYLPDRCEIHRVPRQWLGDIIYSVVGKPFQKWRDDLIEERHNRVKVTRNLDIAITEVALKAFKNASFVPVGNFPST